MLKRGVINFKFCDRNLVSTLILNQFFFFNFKDRPRFVKLFVFCKLLRNIGLVDRMRAIRLFYFFFLFLRRRGFIQTICFKVGKRLIRDGRFCVSVRDISFVEVLYNFVSLVLPKVDLFFFINRSYLGSRVLSGYFSVFHSGFIFRVGDLRGVYFFDRSSLFFNWGELISLFFFLVGGRYLRSERLVLFFNWKLGYAL